jgi:tetratricopeptide (TPR) repeat protein
MKRLFAVVILLFALVPCLRADGPDDQYVQIYNLIQEGDAFGPGQSTDALAKYTEAQTALQTFKKVHPGWNDRVVNFRLNYLASKITILSANTPAAASAPIANTPPVVTNPPITNTPPVVTSPPVTTPPVATAPPVAPTPVPPPPVVTIPTPAAPVVAQQPQGPSAAELQNQIADLQNQLRHLQNDKFLVEAKLREALAARPAGADPREFAQAQDKIRSMEKENALLQVSLAAEREKVASLANSTQLEQTKIELVETKRQLAEQTARATQLAQQNESLQAQIKTMASAKPSGNTSASNADLMKQLAQAKSTIAALEADKDVWRLEKDALQNRVKQLEAPVVASSTPLWTQDSQRVKQLERERDDLQKKLDTAQRELYGRNGKSTAARVDELANQLETLRARLDIYESKPVPYSPEELALFKKPDVIVADPHAGEKPARELPAGTVQLVSQAQQDFSSGSYQQAEQKYLEVLRQDPKNANTLANLATIQLELGHFDDAEKNLKAALAVAPDDSFSLSILGNLKFRQAKYDEALNALSRAAKADPKNPEIQNFLGLTLSEKGMRSAAESAFRKAVLLNPNYGGAQNNLAVFYLTQQPPSVELARWHYDKAIASGFPRNPEMEKALNDKKTADQGH